LAIKRKIVLLGDSAVGKTSLIRRFVFDQFEDSYITTIGSKVTMKEFNIKGSKKDVDLTFMIWDLIGREGYHALHSRTFVGVHGAFLVADLTRKETLDSLERYWIPFLYKVVEDVPLVFACNKSDLKDEYQFQPEELSDLAKKYNGHTIEALPTKLEPTYPTSAKDGSNVDRAFKTLGHLILSSKKYSDPIKELYEGLVATGIRRTSDKTTPIGALDAIIVDFCEGFDDSRLSMLILRQELVRARLDVSNPNKKGILRAVEYLAEAENEFKDEKTVLENLVRRKEWARNVRE
jgi:small GTP-binding protein